VFEIEPAVFEAGAAGLRVEEDCAGRGRAVAVRVSANAYSTKPSHVRMEIVRSFSEQAPNGVQLSGSDEERPSLTALCNPPYLRSVAHAMQLLGERKYSTLRAFALDEVVTGG
jgi:hypothetical protein